MHGPRDPDLSAEEIPRASVSSVAGWDSVATVNIMTLVEEEFGIRISDADLESFVSFELILDCLRSKCHGT